MFVHSEKKHQQLDYFTSKLFQILIFDGFTLNMENNEDNYYEQNTNYSKNMSNN